MNIERADFPRDLAAVRALFDAYFASLGVDLAFQSVADELADIPAKYPVVLVAREGESILGCVALRALADDTCEMKRLYVQPEARGRAVGRALVEALIATARARGFERMVLDSLSTLTSAIQLYRTLGFRQIAAYYDNPLPDVVYMELTLR